MKKTTTILCLGIALCMLGCSDDDDQVTTTSTVPFSLTASLSPRSSDAEDTGILQGNWDANSQLAVIKTGSSGVPKSILTRKTDSSDTFTGNLSTLVKNENEIAVFYPAAAITANSSDTLTQTLNLSGQDGTLAGITTRASTRRTVVHAYKGNSPRRTRTHATCEGQVGERRTADN